MKEVSRYLWKFIKTNFEKKVLQNKKPFSEKTKHFLKQLIQQAKQGEQEWNLEKTSNNIPIMVSLDQIPKGNNYHWIEPIFQQIIEGSPSISRKYVFRIKSRTITIFFVLPVYKNQQISMEKVDAYFEKALKRIYIWLFLLEKYANAECSQNMSIYIYLTEEAKFLPTNKKTPIDKQHANTAFTTSCRKETEINIFREEEWFKVLLHETFHNMGLDFSGMQDIYHTFTKEKILDIFSVESDVNLFETYCEIWGETMNVLFYILFSGDFLHLCTSKTPTLSADLTGKGNSYHALETCEGVKIVENPDKIIEKMEELMNYERMFSLFQSVKVLHHFGMTYEDIINNLKCDKYNTKKYKEKTNVLAYYILKSIGIYNLNTFIEWTIDNNSGSLNFTKTPENLEKYCHFFETYYKNTEYLENMDRIEKWFSQKSKTNKNTLEMKTMRMVVFDF